MIKYLLGCASGHEFESWFRAGADFEAQSRSGEISCPHCGSVNIAKRPMAPSVVTRRTKVEGPSDQVSKATAGGAAAAAPDGATVREALRAFAQTVIANTEDVGGRFADEARKMHFGEIEERQIRGSSTPDEAKELVEDGVPFGILPALPDDLN